MLQEPFWGGGEAHLQNKGREAKQQCGLGAFPPPAVTQIHTVTFEFRVKRCNEPLQEQMKKAPTHLDKSEGLKANVVFSSFKGLKSSLTVPHTNSLSKVAFKVL